MSPSEPPAEEASKEPPRKAYRVLLPLPPGEDAPAAVRLARDLASALEGEVLVVRVLEPDQAPPQEETGNGLSTLHLTAPEPAQGILTAASEHEADLLLLPWTERWQRGRARLGETLATVAANPPCDLMILRPGQPEEPRRLLVAVSGGPHDPTAARLACQLAEIRGGEVTGLTVLRREADERDVEEAQAYLSRAFSELDESLYELRVERSGSVLEAVLRALEDHDAIFFGSSEQAALDRFLFSTMPERVAQRTDKQLIVVRHYRGAADFWLRRLWRGLSYPFPKLDEEGRLDVYRRLRRGARPDVDFFVMTALSTIIATLGLLLNSSAVVIGAMLVAPLMTPVLALGLSISVGDIRMLRLAVESTFKGLALGLLMAVLMTWLSPISTITPEVAARIQPNLLDLGVALAAGAAGAYAVCRRDVSGALAGTAIAVALVPPLGAAGVTLTLGDWDAAGGALLLFGTNLAAINAAAAITFLLLGFRPEKEIRVRSARLRWGLASSFGLLVLVSLPLGVIMGRVAQRTRTERVIQTVLTREVGRMPHTVLSSFKTEGRSPQLTVEVILLSARPPTPEEEEALQEALARALGGPVSLEVLVVPMELHRLEGR